MKIRCLTLFDITRTNISNRRNLLAEPDAENLIRQRNQQSNFETLLQVIGLRAQPEDITDPQRANLKLDTKIWGNKSRSSLVWSFSFTVNHATVYSDDTGPLGNLFADCEGVPMIVNLEESQKLEAQLRTSGSEKNIHFEIDNE